MVFGANTYRAFARMLASSTEESEVRDPWVTRMRNLPTTVVSSTLEGPLDWPDATLESGDAVDVVARVKEESEVPLRSHGGLSMNRALMAAGLDGVQVTLFPVITGRWKMRSSPVCGRLRPRADREPDARRPPPRAQPPAHPACLSPSMHPNPSSSRTCPEVARHADRSHRRRPGHHGLLTPALVRQLHVVLGAGGKGENASWRTTCP